ncbi:MAG: beta-galactosidase, partial [Candidatus Auribacterota bacterium]|nr:beta-galactosidase [Candidatus Auribacterota bacterium]
MKKMLKWIFAGCLFSYVNLFCLTGVYAEEEGWQGKDFFKIRNIKGRPIFISPEGEPFYAISMVYAYGPESGPNKGDLTAGKVIKELERMKEHGFNTIDLYGDFFLKEMLDWCESNEMSLYFRTSYTHLPDFPGHLRDFPDFMDGNFREKAKQQYADFLILIKDYRCVLAVDMDQRWLFEIHWNGEKRFDVPKLGPSGVKYLPVWMKDKYKNIEVLNKLWKKKYSGFEDILKDDEIIKSGVVQPLNRHPWRVDLVEYSNWTINDFLLELTCYMKLVDPNHMITYTTELPEPVPFPLSTKENSGIDFISPVHYNNDSDFDRDWVANGEMFYMTKFHYDLQKLPVYINETGFRTSPLAANPANMGYASARFNDEEHLADLYLIQTALMDTYPWLLGWAWFKWYDKLHEGDFGYVRDDNSLKPVSKLGKVINARIPINMNAEDTPEVWVYYPEHTLDNIPIL